MGKSHFPGISVFRLFAGIPKIAGIPANIPAISQTKYSIIVAYRVTEFKCYVIH